MNTCSICCSFTGETVKHCCCETYSHLHCIKSSSKDTKCYRCGKVYVNQKIINYLLTDEVVRWCNYPGEKLFEIDTEQFIFINNISYLSIFQ
jgi:hypothetical protein